MDVDERQLHRFPCDACGADMRFDPDSGMLVCDHCGNTHRLDDSPKPSAVKELNLARGLAADLPLDETEEQRLAHCDNCGAIVTFDGAVHSLECPFCASPLVADTGATRAIKPKAVAPFEMSEKQARKAMTDWLGRLWFAPGGLQEYARKGRRMQGIYVPYWTFDADTKSSYRGERGTIYYETRTVRRDGKMVTERVQKIRWRPVSGRVARWFDDVLVLAAKSLPGRYTEALEPWGLDKLRPYAPEYLAGFRAEAYTVPLDEGFQTARSKMDAVIRRDVRFDIGGDRQRIHDVNTTMSDLTFKHILLPVWLAAYKYRGKTYRFVVNGQTGRVQGERPWSWIKITFAAIALAIVAAGIGYVVAINQSGGA